MKKLFALISLLGLVLGMGGTLNAQEGVDDTQSKLDTIILYGDFQKNGNNHTVSFKFSATPGEKFIIRWGDYYSRYADTILVENANESEKTYTYSEDYGSPRFNIVFHALTPNGHIKSLRIDSTYKYRELVCQNCILLDTVQVTHNNLENIDFRNCPALTLWDCSYNKITSLYFWPNSNWYDNLTYLNFSHNDIQVFTATDGRALETLDCSYNRRLRSMTLSDCKALVNLTITHNDSLRNYAFNLPQNSPLQSLTLGYTHQFEELDLSQCPNLTTLNCYGNSQLTFINLSNNPKLETLNCFDNEKLATLYIHHTSCDSLDLSSMPTLEFVDCSLNKLSYLNLSGLNNLDFLDCTHNRLSYLNLSGLNNLVFFNCSHNRLSYLDLGGCKNLEHLKCAQNQLSYINLNNCKDLITLDCRNNLFTSLDIPKDLILTDFFCDSNRIPLSVLADLSRHSAVNWYEIHQFPTIAPIQVGNLLDLSGETHLSEYEEQYTLFFNGQQIEERFNDGLADDYGLFTFDKAGDYRLHLKCTVNEGNYVVMSAYYDLTVVDSVVRPQFSIPSGAVLPDTILVLSTPTPNARIYYTTDDRDPGENALLYQEPIRITGAMTVKAIAIRDTFQSHVATASYTIDTVARPIFSIPSGAVVRPDTSLILSTITSGASIYYTTDGSEPDETALAYTAPIRIAEAMTVKAVAIYKTVKSQVTAASYAMDTVARPTFSIASGKVKRGTTVSLNTTTPNARIIYTTDGTEPDNSALEYTEPIRITEAMTIKAVAVYKTVKSQVATASYTIDSVANEHDSRASKFRVYAKDRTIYLSEAVGEVEVFTIDGHCVYRGYDMAIPVKRGGIYVVSAVGRRWKMAVR